MNRLLVIACATLFSGCTYQLQMMPRDGGAVYRGSVSSNGTGSGTVKVDLGGRSCSGPFVTTNSGVGFGLAQTYGAGGSASTFGAASSGTASYKVMMTCSDGSGVRCDVQGMDTGGGICVDSANRVYDIIYS